MANDCTKQFCGFHLNRIITLAVDITARYCLDFVTVRLFYLNPRLRWALCLLCNLAWAVSWGLELLVGNSFAVWLGKDRITLSLGRDMSTV